MVSLVVLSEKEWLTCCGSLKFAEEMVFAGPFSNYQKALTAATHIWFNKVNVPGWLEAFAAHPQIGVTLSNTHKSCAQLCKGGLSTASASAVNSTLQELYEWDIRYRHKFGFVFLIFASGRSAPEILAEMKRRYHNRPIDEFELAAKEEMKIIEYHLLKLFPANVTKKYSRDFLLNIQCSDIPNGFELDRYTIDSSFLVSHDSYEKRRQLKSILNGLSPKTFGELFDIVEQVNIDNVILSELVMQIFDKAVMEPTSCELYANSCSSLAYTLPYLSVHTFRGLLANKCQEEFERGEEREVEVEREEKRFQVRRRKLGNIRLIGELYKRMLLGEKIMHECINKLLGQNENPVEENIEALCTLTSKIWENMDYSEPKDKMDAYFHIMDLFSQNMKLSSRVRLTLKDVVDLRKNKWQQRWQQRRKVKSPNKIYRSCSRHGQ